MSSTNPWFLYLRQTPQGAARVVARESWVLQAERCRAAVERVLPDAACEIVINLGRVGRHTVGENERRPLAPRAAWVRGPNARPIFIEKETADCNLVGLRLDVGMAGQAFGVPVQELQSSLVDLDVLWGREAIEDVRDRLFSAPASRERLAIIEQFVTDRVARSRHSEDAHLARKLVAAVATTRDASVGAIASAHGLTHRRVIALFDAHIGLKPKAFHRVARLRRILDRVHDGRCPSWGAIAHACGYFDQAHFNNDFREMTGMTPRAYAATRSSVGRGFAPYRLAGEA